MNPTIRAALDDAQRCLAAMYGDRLVRVVLYGSQARGDARPESDVDVLVILKDDIDVFAEIKALTRLQLDLLERYGEDLSFQPFTEAEYRQRQSPLMINVRAEGIEL